MDLKSKEIDIFMVSKIIQVHIKSEENLKKELK